jgi:hypothetical protein
VATNRKPAFLLEPDHAWVKYVAEADEKTIPEVIHSIVVFMKVHGIESVTDLRRNYTLNKVYTGEFESQ